MIHRYQFIGMSGIAAAGIALTPGGAERIRIMQR